MKKENNSYWNHKKKCKDHLGNKYDSLSEMAEAYNLTAACLSRRINIYKWSIEKALTTPSTNSPKPVFDHKGNWYKSISELAVHYNLDRKTVAYRLSAGWSMEATLTTPPRTNKEKNHDKK